MCGIAGLVGSFDDELADRLAGALAHRGPDGAGVHRRGDVQLVARRLAILDLAGGAQPMSRGPLTIVFNGEIYNSPQLRGELERDGVAFGSDHSDTEVVLALYEREGAACLDRLNGMFAFAVDDPVRGVVFGARDRLGIKPLYYAEPTAGLAFASELRTLLHAPGIGRELDQESLFHYLSLRFVPGERSILRGVRRLPPGCTFTYDLAARRLAVDRWWTPRFELDPGPSRDEWRLRLREELERAVERWTLSDVPTACSLSGGLDSSAVTALVARLGGDVRTHTLGFTSAEDAALDELPLARALAERYGTEHHEHVVDARELLDDLLTMVWALDEPYGGGLPSWYVFRAIAEDVKVALTGSGGDELFGNYRRFVPFEQGRLARVRRDRVRRYYFEPTYYLTDQEKRRLLVDPPSASTAGLLRGRYEESGSRSARDSVLFLDATTQLPDEFLLMTDRFSMAHSLEARTPFLDHELVALVTSIPPELRTSARDPKGLLRDAVADLLPPGHLQAPKRGFVLPLARWLRGELRPLAERLLADDHLRRQGIFRPGLADRYLRPHLDASRDESERLWPLLMFQLWHLLYVEEGLTEPPSFSWQDVEAAA
jgi:asparagine synthase (glutamine-hydrolysing)